ncbi:MAG: amidase [Proteobacteria bacterium]|nr:amidase [Pseudomonadota bacterium]
MMNRRQMLGGMGAALMWAGCGPSKRTVARDLAEPSAAQLPGAEIAELGIAELSARMSDGRWTAKRITELYLARIEAMNRQGPTLRAVIEINPAAVAIADQRDRERRDGKLRGPMHGIPILLKDNLATADNTETTAGSLALVGAKPGADAHAVKRLREAGAIIVGKANLSEWANFRSNHSISGWSARGGLCRNPYVLDRNPCGSSSGSGVAVAASLCAVAIGTETNGSIVCPSSANGIVGIKPTVGAVSRTGIIPISHTQDTAGPMARSVADAALTLTAMMGEDAADPATAGRSAVDYTSALDRDGLRGARIGVGRNHFGFHPRVDLLMEQAIETIKNAGAVIVDPVKTPTGVEVGAAEITVLLCEFKHGLNRYLASLTGSGPRTLADVIAFNVQHANEELVHFGQDLFERADKTEGLDDPAYRKALAELVTRVRKDGLDKALDEHKLDAILAPTGGPAWTSDLVNGDHFSGSSSTPAAAAGYPNVTVPAGQVNELPVGISFFGRAWSEATLIRIAYAFEQATKHRRPPTYKPSLEAALTPHSSAHRPVCRG